MRKNLHNWILRGEFKEQHLGTVPKSCPSNNTQAMLSLHIDVIDPIRLCWYIKSQNSEEKKIQLDFNWILNFASYVPFNF